MTRLGILGLIFALSGCFDSATDSGKKEEILSYNGAKVYESDSDLPQCDTEAEGELYYIIETNAFILCGTKGYTSLKLTGPDGIQGEIGDAGLKGIDGSQGIYGTLGLIGSDGSDGSAINWLGQTSRPENPDLHDAYYDAKTNAAYIWDGSSWSVLVKDGTDGVDGRSCTVSEAELKVILTCDDGTRIVFKNGVDGVDGNEGNTGEDGLDCTAEADSVTGVVSITCGDSLLVINDMDRDELVDDLDVCPLDHENDIDHDGVCANHDICPLDSNPIQIDSDKDGLGDACDNCPTISNPGQNPDKCKLTDIRDSTIYDIVKIGTQIWMAENLNYTKTVSASYCYSSDPANCDTLGSLYYWSEAVADHGNNEDICPEGWQLPSLEEWNTLRTFVGNSEVGVKLKSKYGWSDTPQGQSGNGNDTYGFKALPAGMKDGNVYTAIGLNARFWTSSESSVSPSGYAHMVDFSYVNGSMSQNATWFKERGLSVRCLKN